MKKYTAEELRLRQQGYYEKNREAWNKYQREYKKKRYNEDDEYKEKTKKYQRDYMKSYKKTK